MLPVVVFAPDRSAEASAHAVVAFRKSHGKTDYSEGRNVTVAHHWLDGQFDQVPAPTADLVPPSSGRHPTTPGDTLVTTAAKATTATIQIVFRSA